MTDQEKPKEIIEERHYFDSNDRSKGFESASKSGFKDKIVGKITSMLNKVEENNISLRPLGYQIILGPDLCFS